MSELDDLYQEIILDHNKRPRNFREMKDFTHTAEGYNPLCGDRYTVFLKIENDIIQDISFQGNGCAISKSSASLMTERLKGATVEEAQEDIEVFQNMLVDEKEIDIPQRLEKIAILKGVKEFPMRIKCATIAWHSTKSAIEGKQNIELD